MAETRRRIFKPLQPGRPGKACGDLIRIGQPVAEQPVTCQRCLQTVVASVSKTELRRLALIVFIRHAGLSDAGAIASASLTETLPQTQKQRHSCGSFYRVTRTASFYVNVGSVISRFAAVYSGARNIKMAGVVLPHWPYI